MQQTFPSWVERDCGWPFLAKNVVWGRLTPSQLPLAECDEGRALRAGCVELGDDGPRLLGRHGERERLLQPAHLQKHISSALGRATARDKTTGTRGGVEVRRGEAEVRGGEAEARSDDAERAHQLQRSWRSTATDLEIRRKLRAPQEAVARLGLRDRRRRAIGRGRGDCIGYCRHRVNGERG
jgi:hypothetical protein